MLRTTSQTRYEIESENIQTSRYNNNRFQLHLCVAASTRGWHLITHDSASSTPAAGQSGVSMNGALSFRLHFFRYIWKELPKDHDYLGCPSIMCLVVLVKGTSGEPSVKRGKE